MPSEKVDILIVCCDIGGAKAIYPVFKRLNNKLNIKIICTVYSQEIFRSCLNKTITDKNQTIDSVRKFFYDNNPKILLTGTSEFSNLERLSWKISSEIGIASIAIVDSWTNPLDRFVYPSKSKGKTKLSMPEVVCVPDKMLKDKILEDGWCTSKIKVCGQPHLEENVKNLFRLRNTSNIFKGLILFISEPVSEKCDSMGLDLGYSQFSVATKLVNEVLSKISILEIKPHPKENIINWQKWKKSLSEDKQIKIKISKSKLDDLICKSEIIVGMASMGLIEAAYSGAPVIALQPNRKFTPNVFIDKCDHIKLITNNENLSDIFQSVKNYNYRANISDLPFYKSVERTSELILDYLNK